MNVYLVLSILTITYVSASSSKEEDGPVIAIVAASIPEDSDDPSEAVVYPTYAKWATNSGAKVIPLLPWYSREKIDSIMDKANGVIWQGGMRKLRIGGHFENFNKYIFDKVLEKNDKHSHFPGFFICQGFELVHILLTNTTSILSNYSAMKYFSPMEKNEATKLSRMYSLFTEEDYLTFEKRNSTVHYHMYGFKPDLYKSYKVLADFFKINSWGYDREGKKFIGSVEGIVYPIYAVQYHPEKVRYDRNISPQNIVNSDEAFAMSKKLADFFVSDSKRSPQKMNEEELKEFLQINTQKDQPIFYHETWVYLYKKSPNYLKR